ncbi:MAG: sensor domain-containing diguanylate cyclase [Blastocatellia bacterium]|nr:sensor domain-containing diguanylate cyclase [Blastocatellia bacterium]
MRVAVVYLDKIPEALLRVLGNCTATEIALFNLRKTDDDFLSRWKPDVVIYQFEDPSEEHQSRFLLSHPRHTLARIPAFSFSNDIKPDLHALAEQIGFIIHLEPLSLTARELELHLVYGLKLAKATGRKLQPAKTSLDKAFEAVTSFHSTLDTAKVLESAMFHLPRLVPAESWALYLSNEPGKPLRLMAAVNALSAGMPPWVDVQNEEHPLVRAVQDGRTHFINDSDDPTEVKLYLPLLTQGSLFGGIVAVLNREHHTFSEEDTEIAERVSASLALALGNATSFTRAENLSQLDDLTHLFNARYFYQALENELKRARRHQLPLAVVFIDLDGFKEVNDIHGHLVGSGTLVEISQQLQSCVRETDILCRYGGDEFILALPEANLQQAHDIAERIRSRIEVTYFQQHRADNVRLTCSIGISVYPEHGKTAELLVKQADEAMYAAKQAQKNQVVVAKVGTMAP